MNNYYTMFDINLRFIFNKQQIKIILLFEIRQYLLSPLFRISKKCIVNINFFFKHGKGKGEGGVKILE